MLEETRAVAANPPTSRMWRLGAPERGRSLGATLRARSNGGYAARTLRPRIVDRRTKEALRLRRHDVYGQRMLHAAMLLPLLLLPLALSGCGTIMRSTVGESEKDRRYLAVRMDAFLLYEYCRPAESGSWDPFPKMWPLAPITIVDLPLAIVIDTLCLPIDWYHYAKLSSDEEFWRDVLAGESVPSAKDCARHFASSGARSVGLGDPRVTGKGLDVLAHIACSEDYGVRFSLEALLQHKQLAPATWVFLYDYAIGKPRELPFTWDALFRSPAMPPEYFQIVADDDDPAHGLSLAGHPGAPPDTLR